MKSERNSYGLVKSAFCDEGIIKLLHCLDKCQNCNQGYAENLTFIVCSSDIKIIQINTVFHL
jgi:hypothetical protein